jgi:hypothetical protein
MIRRRQLLATLSIISAIDLAAAHVSAQPGTKPSMPVMMTAQTCIESCWRSHIMCLETFHYCIEKGAAHVKPLHMALLADCAEMCETTANSLLRRSPKHAAVCIACAEICDACAQECESIKIDDRLLLCAQTCRDCAMHCRAMSKLPV